MKENRRKEEAGLDFTKVTSQKYNDTVNTPRQGILKVYA
jgi:hypothetical protein